MQIYTFRNMFHSYRDPITVQKVDICEKKSLNNKKQIILFSRNFKCFAGLRWRTSILDDVTKTWSLMILFCPYFLNAGSIITRFSTCGHKMTTARTTGHQLLSGKWVQVKSIITKSPRSGGHGYQGQKGTLHQDSRSTSTTALHNRWGTRTWEMRVSGWITSEIGTFLFRREG